MTTVLLVGKAHPRFRERLAPHFDLIELPTADPADITPEMAGRTQGVTTFNQMTPALIDALPNLKIVANFGVGYDGVDATYAASKNVLVTNTPEVLDEEVADTTIGLLLNTVRLLPQAENYLRAGKWVKEGAFRLSPLSLRGRHIGMYGMGRIGQQIARRLEAFNVKISYHTRSPRKDVQYDYHASLKALAEAVDTLVCIVPKTPDTRQTINTEILGALGKNGVLINVGRGWTVSEDDLAKALENGVIAGAGLDVFEDEPNVPEALMKFDNVSLLPHVASASVVTRNAMADLVCDNLIAYFEAGKPITPVPETPVK
ncbi:2-hydroxyacid dehydrogenase [Rhizobium sp. KVB221]|uniref:2-hydroxyacid dehydrogenase n=1 Tax=Rhizobium setariae TaxID=2801340 RepID=A0A936YP51_9HYPH|nr:2-hydroxyacid dehydrogenase [Rhizobium setariae]MBL0371689.1 2-hydroxyacid dehydrogenase [Rhizobium setariae]